MSKLVLEKNIKDMKIKEMQEFLRSVGSYHSLKNKAEYIKRLSAFKNILDFPWRDEQKEVIDNFLNFNYDTYVIHGMFGAGKCHAKDTKIMLYNGKIKNVQDIKVGDLLMGDDSTPRKVLSLARGEDEMYDIIPIKGDKYTVNESHILCLKVTGYPCIEHQEKRHAYFVKWVENNKFHTKTFKYERDNGEDMELKKNQTDNFVDNIKNEQIVEISVKDYLQLPKSRKTQLKGYRTGVEFKETEIFEPYMIGYWLGDDTSSKSRISCQDSTVLHYFNKNLRKYDLTLNYQENYDYNISGYTGKYRSNKFLNTLKDYNLIDNKHIPDDYKYNSREYRLKLLAGLIDSDASYSHGEFEFSQVSDKLMEDTIYLARSLGFACYKKKKKTSWTYKGIKKYGTTYRIFISGEGIEEIPTLIPRKKANPREQIKDVLVTGIKVKHVGRDKYYGFTIDGNRRYLLDDFTVTHNTTLLLGMLIQGIINELYQPSDVMFISFNISIKNEIKSKLKKFGISSKVAVRTFDSIVYEFAKAAEYKYIDLPNFEGKRKFVYELLFNKEFIFKPAYQPKVIFLDECQDLEKQTLDILRYFYNKTKFVFAGDIFQSIQKEPRESILWYYMMLEEKPSIYKIYMSVTPRVPSNNLNTLKKALSIYYPEFKDRISNWTSTNTVSDSDIEWRRFTSYSHIYEDLTGFLNQHSPEEVMILTFSSAITVRGAMGDVARLRRHLVETGFVINSNHKKQEHENYFLTTANSSKGLERDYVIVFLTFPLEKAFVHLSDDVVVNLITVALTRAKKKVIMYVPTYEDKYSRVLSLFEKCPEPSKKRIRDLKILKEFKYQDYIDLEHCPTELIRAGVIKYDTRIRLKEFTKTFNFSKIFDDDINYKIIPIITEEERSFVGVLIENLITSTWICRWPSLQTHDLKNHPFYTHIINRINNAEKRYRQYIGSNMFDDKNHFDGIYLYSQLHIALSNKIFMKLSDGLIMNLKTYWSKLKPKAILMRPHGDKLKIQPNLRMPWLAGVADAMTEDDDGKTISIYEIKASQDRNWTDNALLQIIMYALMLGKTWFRLHILNPFQNQKISYHFDTKQILSLRKELLKDILLWNVNSYMAKTYPSTRTNKKLDVSNTLFVNIIKNEEGEIKQASVLNMLSPIKCEFVYSKYSSSGMQKTKKMTKQEKFACESEMSSGDIEKELRELLHSEIYKDKVIWSFDSYDDIIYMNSIKHFYNMKEFSDIVEYFNYKKNDELQYSADLEDSLFKNIFCLSYMFIKNYFV